MATTTANLKAAFAGGGVDNSHFTLVVVFGQ